MAYGILNKGVPVKRNGLDVMGQDIELKLEELNEEDKSFLAIASTGQKDRDNDVIPTSAWDLKAFLKNPVVLWMHSMWSMPIAKAEMIKVDKTKDLLIFRPKFDANDENAMAIFSKYMGGFLNTFSVGFLGVKYEFNDQENRWSGGRTFSKTELLEVSCVTIPSNPGATVSMRSFGEDPESVRKSLLELGYAQEFQKNESGFFVPVNDMGVFSEPVEMEICKGVIGVYGKSLSDPESPQRVVGYKFNPDSFDSKKVDDFIQQYAEKSYSVSFIEIADSESGFEPKVEEKTFELEITSEKKEQKDETDAPSEEVPVEENQESGAGGVAPESKEGGIRNADSGRKDLDDPEPDEDEEIDLKGVMKFLKCMKKELHAKVDANHETTKQCHDCVSQLKCASKKDASEVVANPEESGKDIHVPELLSGQEKAIDPDSEDGVEIDLESDSPDADNGQKSDFIELDEGITPENLSKTITESVETTVGNIDLSAIMKTTLDKFSGKIPSEE